MHFSVEFYPVQNVLLHTTELWTKMKFRDVEMLKKLLVYLATLGNNDSLSEPPEILAVA